MQPNVAAWRCPTCELPLIKNERRWQCEGHHSFDVAKEGYVNLLLAQHKNSKSPGDSKEMVLARRAFLSEHHYLALATKISEILTSAFDKTATSLTPISIFDAGCGEGYYLNTIAQKLLSQNPKDIHYAFSGIDIAKPAVQKASKGAYEHANANFEFAVASSFNLPVSDASQNAVIQIFAPSKPEEILRILKDGSLWIHVSPASEHLYELKSMVYDKPEKHIPAADKFEGFEMASQYALELEIQLSDLAQRKNLLMMTPFYWTISADKKQVLLETLTYTRAHFNITVFRKI